MRAVVQRVLKAEVSVAGTIKGKIGTGLLVFLGVEARDTVDDLQWLAAKIPVIRCFEDSAGKMNLSVRDIGGEIMVISQFTLFGSLRKGTRPSFNRAADPAMAENMYETFMKRCGEALGQPVACGEFGAMMRIDALNHGPVTLVLDTHDRDF